MMLRKVHLIMLLIFFVSFQALAQAKEYEIEESAPISTVVYFIIIFISVFIILSLYLSRLKYRDLENLNTKKESEIASLHRLIQILCHDIANPLYVISSSALLTKKYIEENNIEKAFNKLNKLLESAGNINDIINDVRALEQIRTHKLEIKTSDICLNSSIEKVIKGFEERCCEKNITIKIIHQFDNCRVYAMPTGLENSILANIVSNAIKFSFPGSTIYFSIYDLGAEIRLDIQDQGIGMPDYILKELFCRNKETTRPGTNHEKGTGFGMLLVKEFMESFGGRVDVTSKAKDLFPTDHGTTISLFFKKAGVNFPLGS